MRPLLVACVTLAPTLPAAAKFAPSVERSISKPVSVVALSDQASAIALAEVAVARSPLGAAGGTGGGGAEPEASAAARLRRPLVRVRPVSDGSDGVVLAIDQGTTGTTVLVFDHAATIRGRAYHEVTQHYPRPGWVEHDPDEIWRGVRMLVGASLRLFMTVAVFTTIARVVRGKRNGFNDREAIGRDQPCDKGVVSATVADDQVSTVYDELVF